MAVLQDLEITYKDTNGYGTYKTETVLSVDLHVSGNLFKMYNTQGHLKMVVNQDSVLKIYARNSKEV